MPEQTILIIRHAEKPEPGALTIPARRIPGR